MWKLICAVVLVGLPWFAESDWELLEAIRRASSAKEAEVAARQLEAKLPEGGDRFAFLSPIVRTLEQRGFVDSAVAVLTRSKGRVGAPFEGRLRLRLSAVQFRHGRLEAAGENVAEGLALVDGEPHEGQRAGLVSDLHGQMGRIHEAAGRFADAITEYEKWEWASFCGVGAFAFLRTRDFAIARCRFEEGETDKALDALIGLIGTGEGGISFDEGEIAVRFAEYSSRAGRDDAAQLLANRVVAARRPEAARLARIGAAVNSLDVPAILAAASDGAATDSLRDASGHARTVVPVVALRELKRLGPAVADAVTRAIVAGDRVVTLLAMQNALPGADDGVRARLEDESDETWRAELTGWMRARADTK